MAWAAGLMFLTEMVMSSVSVLGRSLFGQGIPGDYELVQMLSAMGIAMCLPYCQLRKGHVFVDFFTLWAPASIKRYLDAFGGILLAGCAFLLAWRIWQGMLDMREYEETSMVLGLPIWWGYIPVVPAFALLGVTALHTASNEFCKGSAS
ncbi:MAG: TRAP transporter small permease [Betaproteobacteria bacterium HGW-Betaproteobacteria-6]|nr:MAG: TRAP transporter small permease [Betaproteobacteria bacterium HGW-Betaproteobacteria-6]